MDFLKNLRVGARLGLAFALVLALMLAMAAVGAQLVRSINYYAEYYPQNILPSLRVIHKVDGAIGDVRRLEQQHILTDDDKEKKAMAGRIAQARSEMAKAFKDYEALASDDEDRALLKKVSDAVAAYLALQDKVLKASDESAADPTQGTAAREMSMGAVGSVYLPAREAVATWWEYNEKLAAQATVSAAAAYQRVLWIFGIVSAVALALGALAARIITRSITGPVQQASAAVKAVAGGDLTQRVVSTSRDELGQLLAMLDDMTQNLAGMVSGVRQGCDQLNVAAAEIAQGNADLSARTESQASSLEQTAASVEQMASQIRANADNARQADQLANRASEVAQSGGAAVGEVVATMEAISAASRRIADIIGTIDGIAFQTNILALNAAVEAARAGEQGRGFAVVAGEVRLLAQRSAEAAKEIKSLIGDSVAKVESGSTQVLSARETIDQMVGEVRRVSDLVGEIMVSSREQSEGVGQINTAVSQLDQATQQNAALVEQTAAAAESMRTQTGKLVEAVAAFHVSGAPRQAPLSRAAPAPARPSAAKPVAARPSIKPAAPRPPAGGAASPRPAPPLPPTPPTPPAVTPAPRAAAGAEGDWETF
ncbi:methyl-accepting chemotaxis protein [Pelomonas sp. UHG3]|uniref:Methyl-accepting chemotaxis protein n=1 Tax=Roseateles hydrophilus TaxID=2975054 RepID=A0ACC6CF77_9BURK|nr:methyl-accepting chemotaxis protein [Pelomonas sp. UHG3]MCY4747017.1 methyl-accepting chemotaxis protein [Pelomonas sp. UHG3]